MRSTDFVALLSLDLAICSLLMQWVARLFPARVLLMSLGRQINRRSAGVFAVALICLWIPAGPSQLPLLGYARGVTSDLSITSVMLACLALRQRLWLRPEPAPRERFWLCAALMLVAVVMYPTALGWGNWDAYRLGWGSPALVAGLAFTALASLGAGLKLLPFAVAAGMLAWACNLLESGNLWDYLMYPWLALLASWQTVASAASAWRKRMDDH